MPHEEVRSQSPKIRRGECHVWHISLEETEDGLTRLLRHLSDDEKKRADGFLVPAPRAQYITTRSALRLLLGSYLAIAAEDIAFQSNAYGKPFLPPPHGDLRFNVSHSGNRALIAICMGIDVGIDIEQHRQLADWSGLAKMIWCDEDLDRWMQLSPDDQFMAFYLAWTRKEAIAKALGYGMAANFKMLRARLAPAERAQLIDISPAFGVASEWSLIDIDTAENYSAALAARTSNINVVQHRFTPQCLYRGQGFLSMPSCRG
jgi:4'-phosphopantetheinyl transferase